MYAQMLFVKFAIAEIQDGQLKSQNAMKRPVEKREGTNEGIWKCGCLFKGWKDVRFHHLNHTTSESGV